MSTYVQINIDGSPVLIEVGDLGDGGSDGQRFGAQKTGVKDKTEKVIKLTEDVFEQAKETIFHIATDMISSVKRMDAAVTPAQFELEFGLKFSAKGKVILAEACGEATLNIKLVYHHGKD